MGHHLPQSFEVSLPVSVDQTITLICQQRQQSPPSPDVRHMLATMGEEHAFEVVTRIQKSPGPVKDLNSLLRHRIQEYSTQLHQTQASPLSSGGVSHHSGASPPPPSGGVTVYYSPSSGGNSGGIFYHSGASPSFSSPPFGAASGPYSSSPSVPSAATYSSQFSIPASLSAFNSPQLFSAGATPSLVSSGVDGSSAFRTSGPPSAQLLPPSVPSAVYSPQFLAATAASYSSSPISGVAATAPSRHYSFQSSPAARPLVAYSSPPSAPSSPFSSSFSAAPAPSTANPSPFPAAHPTPLSAGSGSPLLSLPTAFPNDGEGSSGTRDHRSFQSSSYAAACSTAVNRRLPFNDDDFGGRTNWDRTNYVLMILDQLEFRKFFLLLSYLGRHKLEEILSPDDAHSIASMKEIPMAEFELHIWSKYGNRFLKAVDRLQSDQWDSGKTHLYYCDFYQDGISFKGPCLTTTRTHLQRSLGDHNVLIVKFIGEESECANFAFRDGILVGLRRYHFFVFKDDIKDVKKKDRNSSEKGIEPALKNVKCYFVKLDSIGLSGMNEVCPFRDIAKARSLFMHINMVSSMAKYMARFSLILSKTIKLPVDFSSVVIEIIEDIPGLDENGCIVHDKDKKPLIHTDGTGFISEDLALLCPKDFGIAKFINKEFQKFRDFIAFTDIPYGRSGSEASNQEPPLLMQCRLFRQGLAVKGTLLLNRKLRQTIQIRPSMVKVERDMDQPAAQTFDSLEIVAVSQKPRRNYLSKNLIALLSYGGVPRKFFLDLLKSVLDDTFLVFTDTFAAMKVSFHHREMDDNIALNMIFAKIPLNEPYLQDRLSMLAKAERRQLKDGKLPIGESFYLMGTADPTDVLNSNEVCVILENGQISGKVLVYRNPGLHFGDIHVMEAVYVKDLENIIGNAKYGIFFSTKGRRSAAAEMGNGDFDGDLYWVSRNPQLLGSFRASEPWSRIFYTPLSDSKKPSDYSAEALETELFRQFLKTRKPSLSMGVAAESWLSFMDQLLMLEGSRVTEQDNLKLKMLKLIDIYYDAIDAPKSGKKFYQHYHNHSSILALFSKLFKNDAVASFSFHHREMDDNIALNMIFAKIPLNEPYLQDRLSMLAKAERRQLKDGKLPIGESFYLMGTADPTDVLNSNEVCVILENGQISGKVLVYRNPGLHFGDIHVMEAVYVKDLENIIGNAKYGIFFSTKGRRSAAAEMGNGDFDGDLYWVSRNPQLLGSFRASEPWSRIFYTPLSDSKKPSDYSAEALETELFRQFLKTRKPSLSMGVAAESWLSFMDQLLMLEGSRVTEQDNLKLKMLKLIDIYYDAIDAPKSGKKVEIAPHMRAANFPHYMGKNSCISYQSTSVLGEMYDKIQQFESEEGQYKGGIWKLPFFIHCIETRSLGAFLNLWGKRYEEYRKDMTNALKSGSKDSKNANADEVTLKYKLMLYEAEDLDGSRKDKTQIEDEALAIYHLSYDYAIRVNERSRCGFAWKVAGRALCKLLVSNENEPWMYALPSVLKELI